MILIPLGSGMTSIVASELEAPRGFPRVVVSFIPRSTKAPIGQDVTSDIPGKTLEESKPSAVLVFDGDAPVKALDALIDQLLRARTMLTGPGRAA